MKKTNTATALIYLGFFALIGLALYYTKDLGVLAFLLLLPIISDEIGGDNA